MVISSITGKCIIMAVSITATCMVSLIYRLSAKLKKYGR